MMTHDPFQNHQTIGAYQAGSLPFGLPYTAFQSPINPMATTGHPLANPGIGAYGIYPQQIPNPGIALQQGPLQQLLAWNQLAALQNPVFQNPLLQNPGLQYPGFQNPGFQNPGFQNPGFQNPMQNPVPQYPLAQNVWANPLLAANLQNPLLNPAFAYHASQQQPFTYPLAPQTMIGAGAIGQPFGQINPLAQLAALRQVSGYGVSPMAGCF